MNGHRMAAVALYGLAPGDQERILAELPAHDQRILQDYLAELAALGFDKAANMADAAEQPPPPAAPAAAPQDPRARLHGADAANVLAVIGHEPAALIAQLLAIDSWLWADAVVGSLPPHKRKLLRDAADAVVAEAPARTRFLLAAVDAGLQHVSAAESSNRVRRIPAALSKWLPWAQ